MGGLVGGGGGQERRQCQPIGALTFDPNWTNCSDFFREWPWSRKYV